MRALILLFSLTAILICPQGHSSSHATNSHKVATTGHWVLVERLPRPAQRFTQGLVFVDGLLYESTGPRGRSQLARYQDDLRDISQKIDLRHDVHAEGLTFIDGKFYQGSWQSREIFVFDRAFKLLQILPAPVAEVWGITSDGNDLIITDSGNQLIYLDRHSGAEKKRITVSDGSTQHWRWLNELEWVNGKIFANLWHSNWVLKIDPASGNIEARYDFSALIAALAPFSPRGEQVLNGLAWNEEQQQMLLTGKEWPYWFSVQLDPVDKTNSAH